MVRLHKSTVKVTAFSEKVRNLRKGKEQQHMGIDLFFLIAVGYGFFLGFSRGILGTILGIMGFLLALVTAFKFAPAMSDFFQRAFHTENPITFLGGFMTTFLIGLFFFNWLRKMLEAGLAKANLSIINQVAGGFLMAALLITAYSGVIKFMDSAGLIDEAKKDSQSYPILETFPKKTKAVWVKARPMFIEFWNESIEFLDRMQELEQQKRKENRKLREEEETSIFEVN